MMLSVMHWSGCWQNVVTLRNRANKPCHAHTFNSDFSSVKEKDRFCSFMVSGLFVSTLSIGVYTVYIITSILSVPVCMSLSGELFQIYQRTYHLCGLQHRRVAGSCKQITQFWPLRPPESVLGDCRVNSEKRKKTNCHQVSCLFLSSACFAKIASTQSQDDWDCLV